MRQAGAVERVEPPYAADERVTLEAFLDRQRAIVLSKVEGLDQEQLARRLPTSELTLAGLLKHLALVEDDWVQVRFCGRPESEPWASAPWEQDRDWEFHSAVDEDPDALAGSVPRSLRPQPKRPRRRRSGRPIGGSRP